MSHLDHDKLFAQPSTAPSPQSPRVWPGITPESTNTLLKVLKDDNQKYHVFFNEQQFHNHIAHHVLAIWALGATAPLIQAAYDLNASYQRPVITPPESITSQNFNDHLGDEKFYSAYFAYFADAVIHRGAASVFEEHVFSRNFNFDPSIIDQGKQQPEMLSRFLSGLVHPLLHTGCGAEFGLLGIFAEGLAQAAVHQSHTSRLIPTSFPQAASSTDNAPDHLPGLMSSIAINSIRTGPDPAGTSSSEGNVHALTILARIIADPALKGKPDPNQLVMFQTTLNTLGERISKHADAWTVNLSRHGEIEAKIEELIWANTVIYAVGGHDPETDKFKADFFLMHLVTSSLFLPSLAAYLSPRSAALLLKAYFATCLTWWVARGRPGLDIPAFYSSPWRSRHDNDDAGTHTQPSPPALPSPEHADARRPNPWLPLLRSALVHPSDHLCKVQRAFAHFAALYGMRRGGPPCELRGAEVLDGWLFIRAAERTADALGWVREGEMPGSWSREGFYE